MVELNEAIDSLNSEKAVGLDGVPNEVLKCMKSGMREYVRCFVNKCITDRVMPKPLKEGRVCLLFKGGERKDPKCYRPITVNSVFAKVITKLVSKRMTAIVEREGFLSDCQFGFRKGRSTDDAVLVMNTLMAQSKIDKKEMYMSFIDMEKAYDRFDDYSVFLGGLLKLFVLLAA